MFGNRDLSVSSLSEAIRAARSNKTPGGGTTTLSALDDTREPAEGAGAAFGNFGVYYGRSLYGGGVLI